MSNYAPKEGITLGLMNQDFNDLMAEALASNLLSYGLKGDIIVEDVSWEDGIWNVQFIVAPPQEAE